MKQKLLIVLLTLVVQFNSFSQNTSYPCDIATGGTQFESTAPVPAPIGIIPIGGTANFKFSIFNAGSNPSCNIPPFSVRATVSFPTIIGNIQPYIYNGPSTFNTANFVWTFDPVENVLVGENFNQITNNGSVTTSGDFNILIPVLGNAQGTATCGLTILQFGNTSNNPGNNGGESPLSVLAPSALPLSLLEFNATKANCEAQLKWITGFEKDVKHFEIEYSTNGANYTKIGTMVALNRSVPTTYAFTYNQGNSKGFYRLKTIDKDGTYTYSNAIAITTSCAGAKGIKLYPNPVQTNQTLSISISGYEKQLRGELISATGQVVKTMTLRNGTNTLMLTNLSQGFYTLRVSENGGFSEAFKINVMK